jgi:hypothetical protein
MATGMLCAVNTRRAADLGDGGAPDNVLERMSHPSYIFRLSYAQ